MRGIEGRMY